MMEKDRDWNSTFGCGAIDTPMGVTVDNVYTDFCFKC